MIDTNQLFKYKLTDDIFKKVTTVPEGKNHGLIMHLDWSGSMQHQLLDTLKQTMNLFGSVRKQVFHSVCMHSRVHSIINMMTMVTRCIIQDLKPTMNDWYLQ